MDEVHCCHMDTAIKHPVPLPDRVSRHFCIFWHPGTLTLGEERQSARMSKITIDSLTRSAWNITLHSCTHMATAGVKGITDPTRPDPTWPDPVRPEYGTDPRVSTLREVSCCLEILCLTLETSSDISTSYPTSTPSAFDGRVLLQSVVSVCRLSVSYVLW